MVCEREAVAVQLDEPHVDGESVGDCDDDSHTLVDGEAVPEAAGAVALVQ